MAHYAEVIDGIVTRVIVAEPEAVSQIPLEEGGQWVQTSYNTHANVHAEGGIPFRKNYACVGMIYDSVLDAFYDPQPFPSWILDEETGTWVPPLPVPTDDPLQEYEWEEDGNTYRWKKTPRGEMSKEDLKNLPNVKDYVYNAGILVRTDSHYDPQLTTIGTTIGRGTGAREPYNQDHDSVYYWEFPTEDVLSQWKIKDTSNLVRWYGIKTLNDGTSFLKVVRSKANWANEPVLPGEVWVYASVFSKEGVESLVKDIYVKAEPEEIKQWCFENGLSFPLPPEETNKPWCWGVYWDSNTGIIEGIKGYVRYP